MGYIEASTENGIKHLKKEHVIVLFPEGEQGNFKPSSEAYHLQEFKRGFVRMSLQTQAPIVPALVIGAEESNINLKTIRLDKYIPGLVLPLPLNLLPLPVKWKIKFLPPIHLEDPPETINNRARVKEIAKEIQDSIQKELYVELENRPGIFVKRPKWLKKLFKKVTKL